MSLSFKLLGLAIRTAAKPIGNYIKRQAREHDGFRRLAIRGAQAVHRIDMRMRLGILHDADAQQRMHEREQKAAEERKRKSEAPTARTEAEQKKYEEEQARMEKEGEQMQKEEKPPKVKIRPLSEAKAIELGANFFSEAFIFAVAAGLLVWDNWRSRRKESARRDDVAERLSDLEEEVNRLRSRYEPQLEAIVERAKPEKQYSWYNPAGWWRITQPLEGGEIPAVVEQPKAIPGNVPIPQPDKAVKPSASPASDPKEPAAATKADRVEAKHISNAKSTTQASKDAPERVDSVMATKKEQ